MTLITCKVCNKETSDENESCVNCGSPIEDSIIASVLYFIIFVISMVIGFIVGVLTTLVKNPRRSIIVLLPWVIVILIMLLVYLNINSGLQNIASELLDLRYE